jgi:hypothetical protein
LDPLTLIREDARAVFPMALQQDAEVFGAQNILSSGAATGLVVFVHLSVDVLREQVNLGVSTVAGG